MKITIRLFAGLEKKLAQGQDGRQAALEVREGALIADVLDQLGIPATAAKLTLVNGRQSSLQTPLAEGDLLAVFPPVGGG